MLSIKNNHFGMEGVQEHNFTHEFKFLTHKLHFDQNWQ